MDLGGQLEAALPLLFPDYLGFGALMRLRRVSLGLYRQIESDRAMWFCFFRSVQMRWVKSYGPMLDPRKSSWYVARQARRRRSFSTMVLGDLLPTARRCRECGQRNALPTMDFYVCSACACDPGGYSQLVSAQEVRTMVQDAGGGWKRKLPSNFTAYNPPLKVVRRTTPYMKRLYWASDAAELKKRYADRKRADAARERGAERGAAPIRAQ